MNDELILYGGTYLNKGGAAIAYGTINILRKLGVKFSHIIDPEPYFPFEKLGITPIYRYSDSFSINPIPSVSPLYTAKPFVKCIYRSFATDIRKFKGLPIWHIGDSPFSDNRSFLSLFGQVISLNMLKKSLGGPIIIGGVSIDYPKTSLGKRILPDFFKLNVDYTYTRGNETNYILKSFGVNDNKMSRICDFAFHLNEVSSHYSQAFSNRINKINKPRIALIWRDYSNGELRDQYLNSIKNLITLMEKKGYELFFIPTTYAFLIPENDHIFLKNVLNIPSERIIEIKDLSPEEIISVFKNFDVVISTRLHGAVFGTLAHVPTIHLCESGKSLEVMREVFEDKVLLVKLKNFSFGKETQKIVDTIELMLDDYKQISHDIGKSIQDAREFSLTNLENTLPVLLGRESR
jgi:polysaccharide pyruvyl transferase WcaK-like protein